MNITNILITAICISIAYIILRCFVGPYMEKKRIAESEQEDNFLYEGESEVFYLSIKELRKLLEPTMSEAELNLQSKRISVSSALEAINRLQLNPAKIEAWSESTPTPGGDDVVIFPGTFVPTPQHMRGAVGEWSVATIQSPEGGDARCITPTGCDIYAGSLVAVVNPGSRFAGKLPPGVLKTLHILQSQE